MSRDKTTSPHTNKRVRKDRTEEILQEAVKSFAEKGFRGTTTASIAEAVGLTEPGVLHYFPSKVNLLESVLAYRDKQDEARYAPLASSVANKNLSEALGMLEDLVAHNEKVPGLVQLFTVLVAESIREDHPSHKYFVHRYQRIRELFKEYLSGFVDQQDTAQVNLDELVTLIIAVMDGLQIQWLLEPDKVNMPAAFRLFSRLVNVYLQGA